MKRNGLRIRFYTQAILSVPLLFFSADAFAQTPFYQGKTVTIIQGTEAGGSSDVMTRSMLAYLKKHIPGEPTVVSEYMPGGGGIKAANHIFKNVRPDGLTIGRVGGGLVANAVLGETGVLYDLNKFIYLGSPHSTYHWVFITRREAGLEKVSMRCARRPGIRVGAQAVGHSNYFVGRLFAHLIGFKDPKFVVGYGGTELDVALMRGELDGRINNPDTLTIRNAGLVGQQIDRHPRHHGSPQRTQATGLRSPAGDRRVRQVGQGTRVTGDDPHVPADRYSLDIASRNSERPSRYFASSHGQDVQRSGIQKEYKKFVGEEPSPLFGEDMERAIKDLPRDPEIVDLFKKLNAAGPLPGR